MHCGKDTPTAGGLWCFPCVWTARVRAKRRDVTPGTDWPWNPIADRLTLELLLSLYDDEGRLR